MLTDRSREYWDFFISEGVRRKAPLYVRLAEGVRGDETLLVLAAKALSAPAAKVKASQPNDLLLIATGPLAKVLSLL